MNTIRIKKGLNLPIDGQPEQRIAETKNPKRVALLGEDYVGMRPTLHVKVGDSVKLGQLLFTDKKSPRIRYISPGCGTVVAINRGEKRFFLSLVIELTGDKEEVFSSSSAEKVEKMARDQVIDRLIESGEWQAFRARPFSKVADPDDNPHAIFINLMDTQPLAPQMKMILDGREDDLRMGVTVVSRLTGGVLYVCKDPQTEIALGETDRIKIVEFAGPHPAGNVGTHIHFLDPVSRTKQVWSITAQDLLAIGHLFRTGHLDMKRVVALSGTGIKKPRLIATRRGADLQDILQGEVKDGEFRVISGSVLQGRCAHAQRAFLGRYHQQISVLPEGRERHFLGWLGPMTRIHSVKNVVLSKLFYKRMLNLTTALNGGPRAIVPIGSYEKVMPLDILPTFLLRALAVNDVDEAEKLGCLELDEEDLSLCTYVCPSKIDHGANLRNTLNTIEKEG
ncbi:Na(+)-translocating NADH-quinone reductase subunit A [candidate division KSB1 bacterium]|nr:Na(+)-translocating NADH-quinone reductase subunit A [candidate division KSB1 bacterium]